MKKTFAVVMAAALCLFAVTGAQAQYDMEQLVHGDQNQIPWDPNIQGPADVYNYTYTEYGPASNSIAGTMENGINVIDGVDLDNGPMIPGPYLILQDTDGYTVNQAEGLGGLFGLNYGPFMNAPIEAEAEVGSQGNASANIGYQVTDNLNLAVFSAADGAVIDQLLNDSEVNQGVAQSNYAHTPYGNASVLDLDQGISNTTNEAVALYHMDGTVASATNLDATQLVIDGDALTQQGFNAAYAGTGTGSAVINGVMVNGLATSGQSVSNLANSAAGSGSLDLDQQYDADNSYQWGHNQAWAFAVEGMPTTGGDPAVELLQSVYNGVNLAETVKTGADVSGTQQYWDDDWGTEDDDTYGYNSMVAVQFDGTGDASASGIQSVETEINSANFVNGANAYSLNFEGDGFTQLVQSDVNMNDENTTIGGIPAWGSNDYLSNDVEVSADNGNASSNVLQSVTTSLNKMTGGGTLSGNEFAQTLNGTVDQYFHNNVDVYSESGAASATGSQMVTNGINTASLGILSGELDQHGDYGDNYQSGENYIDVDGGNSGGVNGGAAIGTANTAVLQQVVNNQNTAAFTGDVTVTAEYNDQDADYVNQYALNNAYAETGNGTAAGNVDQRTFANLNTLVGDNLTGDILDGGFDQYVGDSSEQISANSLFVNNWDAGNASADGQQVAKANVNTISGLTVTGTVYQNTWGATQNLTNDVAVYAEDGHASSTVNQYSESNVNVLTTNSVVGFVYQDTDGTINQGALSTISAISDENGSATIEGTQTTINKVNVIQAQP